MRQSQKLMKFEVIHIKKLKQQLNTREKYQGAEIKFNILFQMQKMTFEFQKVFW